ncbi:NADH-quinone oxidoreductase subunit NuoI [Acidiphilium acidophilum]
MTSAIRTLWLTFLHLFHKAETIQYPEQQPYLSPRYRGRIVLTRDPDGEERCVSCYLCAAVCPVDCISLQKTAEPDKWTPEHFRINFSRCIFCGFCEEACPTSAIQLIPDFEMSEFSRQNLVYEKENLLIAGTGKVPDYNFYRVAGVNAFGKDKGKALNESEPVDPRGLLP